MALHRRSTIAPGRQVATDACADTSLFPSFLRPSRWAATGGRCVRVWWPQRFAALRTPIISFFSTSLAFSGFLLSSPLLCSALRRPLPTARPLALPVVSPTKPCVARGRCSRRRVSLSPLSLARNGLKNPSDSVGAPFGSCRGPGRAGQLASLVVQDIVDNLILDFLLSRTCRGPCFICRLEFIWSECHNWNFLPKN